MGKEQSTYLSTRQPLGWQDYQLIDSGNFEKLERFGEYTLRRPEPQAVWKPSLPEQEWVKRSDAAFIKEGNADKGRWELLKDIPANWWLNYNHEGLQFRLKISLSSFKHVGVFPEQSDNWDFIYETCKAIGKPKVLNLFAYTGAASLAAKAAGADVSHLDSIKQVVSWARENMERSNLDNIRWVVDDALKFVKREARRGNVYQGIIMDPPAYGRGPEGEKWLLEQHINELLEQSALILAPAPHFLVLNLYSLGFSALISDNLINHHFPNAQNKAFGELFVNDGFDKKLPLGTFYRFFNKG